MTRKKPILFSTPEVQALLNGRKTQTRRVVKPANIFKSARMGGYKQGDGLWIDGYSDANEAKGSIKDYSVSSCWIRQDIYMRDYAPYQPGDILWVRETFDAIPITPEGHMRGHDVFYYKADGDLRPEHWHRKWHPSIHMPRAAARLLLKVTDVRVERVQEITNDNAKAEGVLSTREQVGLKRCAKENPLALGSHKCPDDCNCFNARENFAGLWDTLNAKRGYGWDVNPWVWVITFERI